MKLRYHHLFCTSLYQGKGYSDEFNLHMAKVVEQLRKDPDIQIELVTQCDVICEHCPNRTRLNTCRERDNCIQKKDEIIKGAVFETAGTKWNYQDAQKRAIHSLTKDMFEVCCGSCNWYQQGLCSYEKLKLLFS